MNYFQFLAGVIMKRNYLQFFFFFFFLKSFFSSMLERFTPDDCFLWFKNPKTFLATHSENLVAYVFVNTIGKTEKSLLFNKD